MPGTVLALVVISQCSCEQAVFPALEVLTVYQLCRQESNDYWETYLNAMKMPIYDACM